MFAQPPYIRRVTDYTLDLGRDLDVMREQPGHIMGSLAHAHPFLDGNGRTIMVIHSELTYRAGNWTRNSVETVSTRLGCESH
jgi:cell filamentation protein